MHVDVVLDCSLGFPFVGAHVLLSFVVLAGTGTAH